MRDQYNRTLAIALVLLVACPNGVQAGPLCDFLFGKKQQLPSYPVGQPVPIGNGYGAGYGVYPQTAYGTPAAPSQQPSYSTQYGTYYGSQLPVIGPAGAGYTAPAPSGVAAATLPPTVSYVPNYRTNQYRTPVTYYRPVMTTDPNTGAQVVRMAPCSGYEYQARRVPGWGNTAMYGSSTRPSVVPAPQAFPTYTLPSGGIPLAGATGGSPPMPSASNQAQTQYSSAYPPSATTQPLTPDASSSTRYYQASPPACDGNCQLPATNSQQFGSPPGLVAPPATSSGGTIRTPAPTYGQPTTPPGVTSPPSGTAPVLPPTGTTNRPSDEVFPPNMAPGADPADSPPSLPPTVGARSQQEQRRPQFQNIVRQPREGASGEANREADKNPPSLTPIPVPDDFDPSPSWNPGLLREGDMTAMRPVPAEIAEVAGQSKRIQWASFQDDAHQSKPDWQQSPSSRLRAITPDSDRQVQFKLADQADQTKPMSQAEIMSRVQSPQPTAQSNTSRYDVSGWRSSPK